MFYPAHINLQDRKCLVVGGGTVAERKVVAMLISGGDVTVISPEATELVAFLARSGTLRWQQRQFEPGDTDGYFLVCAATDFTDINTAVFAEAYKKNRIRLVNVVDVIPQCTFAAASVITDGEIMLSISTSGKSPATSRRIREYFEAKLNATSLYTLGYENGKPVQIENQGLPYPIYLLLENRKCVVLYEKKNAAIEGRLSLLNRCGAAITCLSPADLKAEQGRESVEEAFLVIANSAAAVEGACETEAGFIREYLDDAAAGTHITPEFVIDENLIISGSARQRASTDNVKRLHTQLTDQFANAGYGGFIEFLGAQRPAILKALPTPKKRADFFDALIDAVEPNTPHPETCCLRLSNPECRAECLFNWVRRGEFGRAHTFTANLLEKYGVDTPK